MKIKFRLNILIVSIFVFFTIVITFFTFLTKPTVSNLSSILIAIGLISFVALVISLLIANKSYKNLQNLQNDISNLFTGNLTIQIENTGNDEITDLVRKINFFIHTLDDSISYLKKESKQNILAKSQVKKIIDSINHILVLANDSVTNITGYLKNLNQNINKSNQLSESICNDIDMLTSQIATQVMMIENSSDALNEMTTTIDELHQIAAKTNTNSNNLVELAYSGKSALEKSNEQIEEIEKQAYKIEEMVSLIDQIAEQTNILAMNAEIEASHAGEFGRGFSVVAEEIGKLADASSEGSREISTFVSGIISLIKSAREGSVITNNAFEKIDTNIQDVNTAIDDITNALTTTNEKSQGLLQNMVMVKEISTVIDFSSKDIATRAENISDEMQKVDWIADSVNEKMKDIVSSLITLKQVSDDANVVVKGLSDFSTDIATKISNFKTTEIIDLSTIIQNDQKEITEENKETEESVNALKAKLEEEKISIDVPSEEKLNQLKETLEEQKDILTQKKAPDIDVSAIETLDISDFM